jgi:hypothetical protein
LHKEVKTLRKANKRLSKYWRAKKTRIYLRKTFIVQDTEDILDQRDINKQISQEMRQNNRSTRGIRTKI